jgi:hypothetical protein
MKADEFIILKNVNFKFNSEVIVDGATDIFDVLYATRDYFEN